MKLKDISVPHVLMFLGVFFFCLGAVSVIASNWDEIHLTVKLCFSAMLLPASLYGALHFYRRGRRWQQELCILAAFLLIGANIALIAQVFHIDGSIRGVFLTWAIAGLPLALLTRIRLVPFILLPMFLFGMDFLKVAGLIERWVEYRIMMIYISASFFTALYLLVKIVQKMWKFEMPLIAAFRLWNALLAYAMLFLAPLSVYNYQGIDMPQLLSMLAFAAAFFTVWLGIALYFYKNNLRRFYLHSVMCCVFVSWVYLILVRDLLSTGLFFMGVGLMLLGMVYGFMRFKKKRNAKIAAKNKK